MAQAPPGPNSQAATQEIPDDYDDDDEEMKSQSQEDGMWARLIPCNGKYETIDVKANELTFGRKSDCDVKFTEPAVSGYHCRLWREPQDDDKNQPVVWIYDTSTNGTFLSGKKIGNGCRALLTDGKKFALIPPGNQKKREAISYTFLLRKQQPEGDVYEKYEITNEIGKGAFAAVYRCIEKSTGEKYAMKIIDKKRFFQKAKSKRENALFDEVNILKSVNHENIIKVIDVFDSDDQLHIVLELALGGDLFDKVVAIKKFPEARARFITKQILDAIMYLHENKIVHRDLKPENILLKEKNSDVIKLSDFGLSRLVGDTSFIQTICGTPQYIAPELLTKKEGYTKDVDYWSIGVILYILLSGAPPFHDGRSKPVLEQVKSGDYRFPDSLFKDISKEAIDLVKQLLEVDCNKRIKAKDVLSHPWMKQGSDTMDSSPLDNKRKETAPTASKSTSTEKMSTSSGESISQPQRKSKRQRK